MSHATISFLVLGAAVVLFVTNRIPPEIVALGAALALYALRVIGADQVVAGFGDPAVIFIASLFVVSEALDATGVTAWAGQRLIAQAGASARMLLILMLALVAVVSALITPNGSVSATCRSRWSVFPSSTLGPRNCCKASSRPAEDVRKCAPRARDPAADRLRVELYQPGSRRLGALLGS